MGSVKEPEDIFSYADQASIPIKNFTSICTYVTMINSRGFFHNSNPLHFSVPLLLLQLSLGSCVILLTSQLLKPLGQPMLVAQLLGGIILGPSLLGQSNSFTSLIFPLRGFMMLDILSAFGFMYYFFLIGIQMDTSVVKNIDRKAFAIGFASVATPMVLSALSAVLLMHFVSVDPKIANSLPVVAQAESVLAFPVVAYLLSELRIINSEFGRVALSSSTVSGLCSVCVMTTTVLMNQPAGEDYKMLQTTANAIALTVVIIFVVRPAVLQMIKGHPVGEPLKETYVFALCLAVLVLGFCSQAIGLHTYFGPLILGIIVPAGPPVGSAMVEKLEFITHWMFMPMFFVKNGVMMNIFAIKWKNYLTVQFIALVSVFGKFLGAFLSSLCCKIPIRDAASLGLVMNAQGILELGMFIMLKKNMEIDNESFVVMCASMLLLMGTITPIIRYLYDPSRRYVVYRRRTVMHSKPNAELRVLVCIHDQENVPTAINILEALNPTKRSPLGVHMLHLIELIGRANPILISHKLTKRPSSKAISSQHVVNAFRYFEQSNYGLVTVFPFTAISPPTTMHDDVCTIALDKRISLVMVPFHKRFHANGAQGSYKKVIKITNNNVLDKAPCSVAVLVDRGLLKSSRPILESWSSYRVAVLFLGGADDREAVAIGARMARHPHINLTMIRLLENGNIRSGNQKESRLDNEVVSDFRTSMSGNYRVMYIEEVVMDGTGTISVIQSMENHYELVMVGRNHDSLSPLVSGLTDWNEHRELGAIGELLATADFMGNATILVVQQHTNVENESQSHEGKNFRDPNEVEESEDMPIHRRSV